ncbi:uncharacterized protein LOC128574119 isoform X3 [Nycticebus coucang]|uniref:uncharacterized protein LOC128574089 isoform X5 n=1 Tax=Nycticebus coucang TaxID=9470 RepID=UPI00234E2534|nr:uncharacterized protein LOC128574089 isoform X5 [Nycticebus coucang]XP_053430780.1 uncharacterized protein LOC128574119 isoform X3 [Nycticebus coucang]
MIGAGAPCTCPACLPCTCHPHLPGDSVLQTCRWATHCMGAPSQPEGAAGQTRISLISPPQDGHVGSISYRGPQNLSLTPNQSMAKPLSEVISKTKLASLLRPSSYLQGLHTMGVCAREGDLLGSHSLSQHRPHT